MHWWLRWITLRLNQHLRSLTWPALAGLVIGHAITSYLFLVVAKETSLTENLSQYTYWFMVTISTVGYGDFSPETTAGMWVVTLWVIPLGLGLFGSFIGKLATTISLTWEQTMKGERDFSHLSDHIILLGWTQTQTLKIIDLILGDKNRKPRQILLCVTNDIEHPCPDRLEVSFVHINSYSDPENLMRAGVNKAAKIIIDGDSDEETLAIALRIGALTKPEITHVSTYFNNASIAQLLQTTYPKMEVSTSREAEILTRSMQDPGSSRVFEKLMNTLDGATQFSMNLPDDLPTTTFGQLFLFFKQQHQATLIAVAEHSTRGDVEINPSMDMVISGGVTLYYIAASRLKISDEVWSQINSH
jgi:voltage-gated potassium channel